MTDVGPTQPGDGWVEIATHKRHQSNSKATPLPGGIIMRQLLTS